MPHPISARTLQSIAMGNWRNILSSAGIPAERLDGRGHACPRCGGRDRFAAFDQLDQRGAVHCRQCFTRGTDPRPGNGIATLMWFLGTDFTETLKWLADHLGVGPHGGSSTLTTAFLATGVTTGSSRAPIRTVSASCIARMTELTTDCMRRITPTHFETLSQSLGVSADSLRSLCIGYSTDHNATTWPMRNAQGDIVGIRLRSWTGSKKWSINGSHSGLFLSRTHRPSGPHVFIVEGASDLAAALDLGLPSIGRPSCRGGFHYTLNYLQRVGFTSVTIITDNDAAGRSGGVALANDLAKQAIGATVIMAPGKGNDLRESVKAGITADVLQQSKPIHAAQARSVAVQLTMNFAASDPAMNVSLN